jgi:hypothetical protein
MVSETTILGTSIFDGQPVPGQVIVFPLPVSHPTRSRRPGRFAYLPEAPDMPHPPDFIRRARPILGRSARSFAETCTT